VKILPLLLSILGVYAPSQCFAQTAPDLSAVDSYINPYVDTNNFSGIVLIKKDYQIIFEKSYGFADREGNAKNSANTRFHIASISMQYTAVAILRLIDQGSLSFDTRVDSVVSGVEGGDKITIRDLLLQRSGLPDINDLPSYNEILNQHETPASLVAAIKGRSLIFEPGSKYLHEEHSGYNLLALILEVKTHLPFASAIEKLVFRPAGIARG
jgi:CubicO group peptidase (beta-lactamase class C family)